MFWTSVLWQTLKLGIHLMSRCTHPTIKLARSGS